MGMKEELAKIVGKENVSSAIKDRTQYSQDMSLLPPGMPDLVAKAKSAEEVSAIVKLCNERNTPLVPVASRVHFNGCTIPKQGGVVLDLTGMNRVFEIDLDNRRVRFEPGVTWRQLVDELEKKGMRVIMPLLPHAERSVLTDYLEREVPTNTVYDYGEPMQSMELVWPTGEIFRLGSASVNNYPDSMSKGANPSGPGLDFYRFLQGAQGTMGVLTWTNLKIESIPKIDKVYFAAVNDLSYAQDFLYRILPRRIGQEVVLLNNIDLATIVAENWPADFEKLRDTLPPWTLILVISGLLRRPEEKVAYEESFLADVVKNEYKGIAFIDNLPGFPGLGKKMLPLLRKPWSKPVYWKNQWKGASQSLFFIARPSNSTYYVDIVEDIAVRHGYPIADIGMYVQPIEHNRACQMDFTFFYNPASSNDTAFISVLQRDAAMALMNEGAFFSRPYGKLAPIIYDRAAGYTQALKRVKKVFDPKNIMNPGNLCF